MEDLLVGMVLSVTWDNCSIDSTNEFLSGVDSEVLVAGTKRLVLNLLTHSIYTLCKYPSSSRVGYFLFSQYLWALIEWIILNPTVVWAKCYLLFWDSTQMKLKVQVERYIRLLDRYILRNKAPHTLWVTTIVCTTIGLFEAPLHPIFFAVSNCLP